MEHPTHQHKIVSRKKPGTEPETTDRTLPRLQRTETPGVRQPVAEDSVAFLFRQALSQSLQVEAGKTKSGIALRPEYKKIV
jgi:hypothetical protein